MGCVAIVGLIASVTLLSTIATLHAEDSAANKLTEKSSAQPSTNSHASFIDGAVHLDANASRCQSLPLDGVRQRIIDTALSEWATFRYQSVDVSTLPARPIPGFPRPSAPHPRSESGPQQLAMIATFWAVAPFGMKHVVDQNKIWKTSPDQEWRDHWSAAFTSWVMCKSGLDEVQFARNVQHVKYIEHAIEDARSAFSPAPAGALPGPGDLLCAQEGFSGSSKQAFDPDHPATLIGLLLHCYVVAVSGKTSTYVVGGNVVDWSKTPPGKFGGVGLLIVDNKSISTKGSSTPCENSRPCWLLGLSLKVDEKASYQKSPLDTAARTLLDKASASTERP